MKPINEIDMEQLSAYIDGELSDSERRFFQKRLAADAGLRAACERAWIASSVLKSQPIQLMPASCADAVSARCEDNVQTRGPWRMVASFAALAVAFGLGLQLLPSGQHEAVPLVQGESVSGQAQPASASPAIAQQELPALATVPAKDTTPAAKPSGPTPSISRDSGNPSEFALNEAVLAKSWPQRDAVMQDYLVRHNRMAGNAAGNDLIAFAELLAEPQPAAEEPEQEQKE